jgi:hypothetical protein
LASVFAAVGVEPELSELAEEVEESDWVVSALASLFDASPFAPSPEDFRA